MLFTWIASFKRNSSLDIYGGIKKCFTMEEKEVCVYVLWIFEFYYAKTLLTRALNIWDIDRSVDWLV